MSPFVFSSRVRWVLVSILGLLAGAVLGLYLASPWLAQRAALIAADAYGISDIIIDIERPGLGHVRVLNVELTAPGYRLVGSDMHIAYTFAGLIKGQLEDIQVQELTLVLDAVQEGDTSANETDLSPDVLFPVLPVESINVENLRLEVPELEFAGAGSVLWAAEELAFSFAGISPEAASRFVIEATLSRAGQFDARFGESGADTVDILRAAGRIEDDRLALVGSVDLHGYALSLGSTLAGIPHGKGRITGAFDASSPWPPAADLSWQDLNATVEGGALQWTSATDELTLGLSIESISLDGGTVDAVVSGSIQGIRDEVRGLLELPARYALRFRDGVLSGAAGPKLKVEMETANMSATIQQFNLEPNAARPLTFTADVAADVELLQLAGQLSGQVAPILGDVTYQGEVDVQNVTHSGQVAAAYQLDGDALAVTGEVNAAQIKNAAFNLAYDLTSGAGSLHAANKLTLGKPLFASLLPEWTESYDIDSGVMDITANASWRTPEKIAGQVRIALEGVAAHYDDYLASDIRGVFDLSAEHLAHANWLLAPAKLNVGMLDVGFPIEDMELNVAGDFNALRITDAHAKLLGGRARAAPFDYDLNSGNSQFSLTLEALDLAQVLALEGEDVAGSGTLEGTLPITVRGNAVSMQNGTVRALPPGGAIQLSPSLARGTGQPGLDFALVALQDFRFSALSGDIDYAENGDMVLAMKLKGNNPAVEKGRAIEYNLNITENLPTLLESLRLQDEVQTRIERKLNQ